MDRRSPVSIATRNVFQIVGLMSFLIAVVTAIQDDSTACAEDLQPEFVMEWGEPGEGAGEYLKTWGNKSDEPGGFGRYSLNGLRETVGPIGISIDRHDRILISSLNDRVQYFDTDGIFLFGIEGTDKPDGQLLHPHGMAFDKEHFLYIADAGNQRILKFQVPTAPKTQQK